MGSIIMETATALRSLMNSGWCARRKEPPVAMTMQDKGPTSVKPPVPATEEQPALSASPPIAAKDLKETSYSELESIAEKIASRANIDKISTSGPAVAKPLSSKQKVTSDSDKSTTAGSGDLTEDDRFCDSGSDLEGVRAAAALLAKPACVPPPPGLAPPPGLDHPSIEVPPGIVHPSNNKATALKTSPYQTSKYHGTRLNSQATPFVPVFSKKAAPANAKKISISMELEKAEGPNSSNPGKFVGAAHHLQQSLAQLKGALAEWEACMPDKDAPASKEAVQTVKDTGTVELVNKISSLMESNAATSTVMGKAKACNTMSVPSQQQWNLPVIEPTAVMANAAWLGMAAPAWHAQGASLEQQPWQRVSNLRNCPKQGKQLNTTPSTHMTADELPADTLRTNLQELDKMPAERVLIVRRINRLGLESPTFLESHFSKYGVVEKVLVSHSRTKSHYNGKPARVRPAGLGFILMSSTEETQAILNLGQEQVINGAVINVQAYETRAPEVTIQQEDGEHKVPEEQMAETKDMRFQ